MLTFADVLRVVAWSFCSVVGCQPEYDPPDFKKRELRKSISGSNDGFGHTWIARAVTRTVDNMQLAAWPGP